MADESSRTDLTGKFRLGRDGAVSVDRDAVSATIALDPEELVSIVGASPGERLSLDQILAVSPVDSADERVAPEYDVPRKKVEPELMIGDEIPVVDTSLEELLDSKGLTFFAQYPCTVEYEFGGVHKQFTAEKILYWDEANVDLGVFLTNSDRDDSSLTHLNTLERLPVSNQIIDHSEGKRAIRERVDGKSYNLFYTKEKPTHIHNGSRVILKQFDEGGCADVYLVYNRDDNELEVLKYAKLNEDGTPNQFTTNLLWNEVEKYRLFGDHPNIVKFKGFYRDPDSCRDFFATEYCDMTCQQLFDVALEKYNGGDKDAMNRAFHQAFEGIIPILEMLYERGIVQIDFKKDNVLLKKHRIHGDKSGKVYWRAKLIDPATAQDEEESRSCGELICSPGTVEPEMLIPYLYAQNVMGRPDLMRVEKEPLADIYSAGRFMLELIDDTHGLGYMRLEELYDLFAPLTMASVPRLMELNMEQIFRTKLWNGVQKDKTGHSPYSSRVFKILEALTDVRTNRVTVPELKTYDYASHGPAVKHPDAEGIKMEHYPLRMPLDPKNDDSIFVQNILDVVGHLREVQEAGHVYLDMHYDKKRGDIVFGGRVSVPQLERWGPQSFRPKYYEPDAVMFLLGTYAAAGCTNNKKVKDALYRARRIDGERSTQIHQFSRVLNEALAHGEDLVLEGIDGRVVISLDGTSSSGAYQEEFNHVLEALSGDDLSGYVASLKHKDTDPFNTAEYLNALFAKQDQECDQAFSVLQSRDRDLLARIAYLGSRSRMDSRSITFDDVELKLRTKYASILGQ